MMKSILSERLLEHQQIMQTLENQTDAFLRASDKMIESLRAGGKICFMGNGGSAADSQHLAAELVGRFQRERQALAALAFSTNTSILTAIANDYDYETVFSRQVEALCHPQDVIIGISTSGNSGNVLKAFQKAREMGVFTIALTGGSGGKMADAADICFRVDSARTARIQEGHIFLGHCLCEAVEEAFAQ